MNDPDWRKMMLTLVALVAVLVMVISLLLLLRYRPPRRDAAARLYARFVRRTGLEPTIGETPLDFARRASGSGKVTEEAIEQITRAYLESRYGPDDAMAFERLRFAVRAIA